MRLFRGWRPALRIARREALRARGRSVLVLVMIGLPVLGIVALDTLARTSDVSTVEGLTRQIGSADALVTSSGARHRSTRRRTCRRPGRRPTVRPATTRAAHARRPPRCARCSAPTPGCWSASTGRVAVRTDVGLARPTAVGLDLQDPMTRGLFDLRDGRYPRGEDEVVVSARLAGRGFPVGSTLTLADGTALRVVGTVESTTTRGLSLLAGPAAAVGPRPGRRHRRGRGRLAGLPAGRRRLGHRAGAERARACSPCPGRSSRTRRRRPRSPCRRTTAGSTAPMVAVLALVVAMALLEVVLLAGPAFAVGARRQQRALALMAASGAEPPHLRRVVHGQRRRARDGCGRGRLRAGGRRRLAGPAARAAVQRHGARPVRGGAARHRRHRGVSACSARCWPRCCRH